MLPPIISAGQSLAACGQGRNRNIVRHAFRITTMEIVTATFAETATTSQAVAVMHHEDTRPYGGQCSLGAPLLTGGDTTGGRIHNAFRLRNVFSIRETLQSIAV